MNKKATTFQIDTLQNCHLIQTHILYRKVTSPHIIRAEIGCNEIKLLLH